ncbi:carbohydrate porin [Singulisphaera sp. Ch08]|uniref:Carbohydrate porin n=1 Tax=Singulisphaera sp. Ch08 TaxID=3120278 RepID=A0AAU7CJ90_9BACT
MIRVGCHKWGWVVLLPGVLVLLALSSTRAQAQNAVIIPGLPGANLPAGARPVPTAWPYSDLPGGRSATTTETTESPTPAASSSLLMGNWFGARDALFEKGIDLRTNLSQFYQGVTRGGLRQSFPYGLKLDYFGTIEAEKLFGWEGLFLNLHGESRFGQSVNRDTGSLIPANFALEFPKPTGSASALTNLQVEQFLGPDFVVTFGKLNAADGVNIHPFLGGNGINRFMNEAFVLSPIYGHTIPYSTPGAGLSYLRENDPVFTFLVLDSSGRPDTSGLSRMFRNGATMFASLRLPVTPFGLPGHQTLEMAFATGKFSPLTEDDYVILPQRGTNSLRRNGEYVLTYGFDQFIVINAENPNKGWGVFGNASLANEQTNPIHWLLNLGAGGASPLPGRAADSFGVGYYYLGTSRVLRDALRTVSPVRNDQGFELYYNAAITNWFTLAADVQAIDPAQFNARSSFLFGLRAKIDF